MCFIGHGAFGIITKAIWCNYFALFGIGKVMAYRLMPVAGTADILLGILLLMKPYRAIPAWLVIWGIITAFCRPLIWRTICRIPGTGRQLWSSALPVGAVWWYKAEYRLVSFCDQPE